MTSFISWRKSVLTIFVLALVAISNINEVAGASTYSDIDISKTAGSVAEIKAAADKFFGASLSAEELTRRHGLSDTAELNFFNPRVIESLITNNAKLNQALNCQKKRNKVLKYTCELQASIKKNLQCETKKYTKSVASEIKGLNKTCKGVDEKLFVTVTGINEPLPPSPAEVCGAPKPVFTSKFSDVDITRTPGSGDAIKIEAERVCGANLSEQELGHRVNLAKQAAKKVFKAQIKKAKGNKALKKALNCQKIKNQITISTCAIQHAIKRNKHFQVEENTLKRQKTIEKSVAACANVDAKLFIDGSVVTPASVKKSTSAADNVRPSAVFLVLLICLFA